MRGTRKDYARFISIARGSVAEVETFLMLAVRTGLLPEREALSAMQLADRLGRQLNVLWNRLSKPNPPSQSQIPIP